MNALIDTFRMEIIRLNTKIERTKLSRHLLQGYRNKIEILLHRSISSIRSNT